MTRLPMQSPEEKTIIALKQSNEVIMQVRQSRNSQDALIHRSLAEIADSRDAIIKANAALDRSRSFQNLWIALSFLVAGITV